MRKLLHPLIIAAAIVASMPFVALADYAYRDANSTLLTVMTWACVTGKICPAFVMTDSSGNEKGTPTNPVNVARTQVAIAATATPQLSVTSSSARVALGDTSGNYSNLIVSNLGSQTAYYAVGTSSVTATTSSTPIPPGVTVQVPQGATTNTNLAAITSTGTTTLNVIQTSSPMQIAGGAGAGGGGGGSVTQGTTPWNVGGAVASSTAMQTAAVANGNGATLAVGNYDTALININCSVACSGGTTINFEGTDSTGTYFSILAFPLLGGTPVSTVTNGGGQFWVPLHGLTTIRARISAYSAGTITVTGTPMYGTVATLTQVANATANQSNASSGVATGSGNSPTIAYLYCFNGTTWDQCQDDANKNLKVAPQATPAGGATPAHYLSAASNNATNVKSSAGTVYGLTIINTTTNLGDFRFYDTGSTPTCSSATGVVKNYVIQSNATSPGLHISWPVGMKFASGISFCYTGANADNDNTNATTGVNINLDYNYLLKRDIDPADDSAPAFVDQAA